MTAQGRDAEDRGLYRAGGWSALVLGGSYLVITVLYVLVGAVPRESAQEWLEHLADNAPAWWAIVGLSALTDILFFPVAAALYLALRTVERNAMLVGSGFLVLFAVLDLAVTQLNFATLITLSGDYAATTDETTRATLVAAASYAAAVLNSELFAAYVLAVPGLGILVIGLVMLRGAFGRLAGYAGVAAGALGIVAVAGPLVWSPLDSLYILAAVLTTVWVFAVGWRLLRLVEV